MRKGLVMFSSVERLHRLRAVGERSKPRDDFV